MNIIELVQKLTHDEVFVFTHTDLEELVTAIAKQAVEEFKAGLVPVAHIDIAKRKVILDNTITFKTPTVAVMDNVPLYALPKETK